MAHEDQLKNDRVPATPVAAPIPLTQVTSLREDVAALQETARRIDSAARDLATVAAATTIKLNNKQKMYVAGTAIALVGVGVGGTLIVQKIASSRSAKKPMMPAGK